MATINHELMELFRLKIYQLRTTQKQIAKQVGIAPRRFSEMLNADRPMPLDVRYRLVEMLDLQNNLEQMVRQKRKNNVR